MKKPEAALKLILNDGRSRSSSLKYMHISQGQAVTAGLTESFEDDVLIDQLIISKNGFEYIVDDINCLVAKGKRQQITLENVTGDDIRSAAGEGRNLFTFEAQVDGDPLAHMGLYYFGARFYDADVGVFVGVDPLEQFSNTYTYCAGNPIKYIDPDGAFVPIEGIVGATGGAIIGGILANNNDIPIGAGILMGAGYGFMAGMVLGGTLGDIPLFNDGAHYLPSLTNFSSGRTIGTLSIYSIQVMASETFLTIGKHKFSISYGQHAFLKLELDQGRILYLNEELKYFDTWGGYPGVRNDLTSNSSNITGITPEQAKLFERIVNANNDFVRDYGPNQISSRSARISKAQLSVLLRRIDEINHGVKLGKKSHTPLNPCSAFAADVWKEVIGETLGHRSPGYYYLKSDPSILYKSIRKANKGTH